ncbi:MAG: MarR family winged helix-turn-helix transcriptional regulator [Bacteroidota bacterium]
MSIEIDIKQTKFSSPYHRLGVNLLYTAAWLENEHRQLLKPFGITLQQFNVLRILRGQKGNPISVMGVCERMIDKSSNASRLIDKLIERGFVRRTVCPQDRRQVDVIITEKGLSLINNTDNLTMEMDLLLSKVLNQGQATEISDLLDKIRNINNSK